MAGSPRDSGFYEKKQIIIKESKKHTAKVIDFSKVRKNETKNDK